MANGSSKFGSRKFTIAGVSLLASIFALVWGVATCETAQDIAIVIGAWGVVDAAILKLYNDANLKDRNGGMV